MKKPVSTAEIIVIGLIVALGFYIFGSLKPSEFPDSWKNYTWADGPADVHVRVFNVHECPWNTEGLFYENTRFYGYGQDYAIYSGYLYTSPQGNVITWLRGNTLLTVTDWPICKDNGQVWWIVKTPNAEGWIQDSNLKQVSEF